MELHDLLSRQIYLIKHSLEPLMSHFSDLKFYAVGWIPATWRLKRSKWELVTVIDRQKKKKQKRDPSTVRFVKRLL